MKANNINDFFEHIFYPTERVAAFLKNRIEPGNFDNWNIIEDAAKGCYGNENQVEASYQLLMTKFWLEKNPNQNLQETLDRTLRSISEFMNEMENATLEEKRMKYLSDSGINISFYRNDNSE